jgi:hypothetical protein
MKASQNQKHLGQSIGLGLVLVVMSVSVFVLMLTQSSALQ